MTSTYSTMTNTYSPNAAGTFTTGTSSVVPASDMAATLTTLTSSIPTEVPALEAQTLFRVSIGDYFTILACWFIYCQSGSWSTSRPWRWVTLIQGYVKLLLYLLYLKEKDMIMSMFVTYLLGRIRLGTGLVGYSQSFMILAWVVMDTMTVFMEDMMWPTVFWEGLMSVGLLSYLLILACSLRKEGRDRWLQRIGAIVVWGLGWGVLSLLYRLHLLNQLSILAWFMTYAALFPVIDHPEEPRPSTPPLPFSPWLSYVGAQKAQEDHSGTL